MAVWTIILFLVGFYILVKGARILVDGASSVARLFKISPWVVGIVIVGIGTSVPELAINIASAVAGTSIGVGTIIGSNIFNALFILGAVAVVGAVRFRPQWVHRDIMLTLLAILFTGAFLIFPLIGDFSGVTRGEGAIVFLAFVGWVWFMLRQKREESPDEDYTSFTLTTSLLLIIGGILGVFFGGRWVVDGASVIATWLGVGESVIALTIVGAGTSLPELTVSLAAAWRGRGDIAVGNIIGSNIFDFLGIIGITSLIRPVPFVITLIPDLAFAFVAILLILGSLFMGDDYVLKRRYGALFIALYIGYLILLLTHAVG